MPDGRSQDTVTVNPGGFTTPAGAMTVSRPHSCRLERGSAHCPVCRTVLDVHLELGTVECDGCAGVFRVPVPASLAPLPPARFRVETLEAGRHVWRRCSWWQELTVIPLGVGAFAAWQFLESGQVALAVASSLLALALVAVPPGWLQDLHVRALGDRVLSWRGRLPVLGTSVRCADVRCVWAVRVKGRLTELEALVRGNQTHAVVAELHDGTRVVLAKGLVDAREAVFLAEQVEEHVVQQRGAAG